MKDPGSAPVYLAVDFGAGSGRLIAGVLEDGKLRLEEVHRFANPGIRLNGTWHWRVSSQFGHLLDGLKLAAEKYGDRVESVGIDTWGVDYGLIDSEGRLLGIPVQYRDSRTDGQMEKTFEQVPKAEIYRATGNEFMALNTLFQLRTESPERLAAASRILLMPDLFNFWLSGIPANEATIASTTQLVNAATGEWAIDLIDRLGLPRKLFREITPPATVLGPLLPEIAKETGLNCRVVTVGSHDTASAYAAVPAKHGDEVFLSSGTWSLLGTLVKDPVITEESFQRSFTNERAAGGEIRLLKNLCGMWLIQECKRIWDEQEPVPWETLIKEAEAAEAFVSLIDPDDPRLSKPCDMPEVLRQVCADSGQPVPASRGAVARMIFESLALKYRVVFEDLEHLTGNPLGTFHVVGGGCRNDLLNQFTANALNRQVVAGPVEATAAGNILCQLLANGHLSSLREGSGLIRDSFDVKTFAPQNSPQWEEALNRFRKRL